LVPLDPHGVSVVLQVVEDGTTSLALVEDYVTGRRFLLLLDTIRFFKYESCGEAVARALAPGVLERYEQCPDQACADSVIKQYIGAPDPLNAVPLTGPIPSVVDVKHEAIEFGLVSTQTGTGYATVHSLPVRRAMRLQRGWNRVVMRVGSHFRPGRHSLIITVEHGLRHHTYRRTISVRRVRPG
jgi:hypothetical protein